MFWGESSVKNDGSGPHNSSGIERASYSTAGVIAHEQSAKLQACGLQTLGRGGPLAHFSIGILQIARLGARSEVAPPSDDTVAQKAIVGFVGPALKVNVGNFTAHFAMGANHSGSFDASPHAHRGAFVHQKRAFKVTAGFNDGLGADLDLGLGVGGNVSS